MLISPLQIKIIKIDWFLNKLSEGKHQIAKKEIAYEFFDFLVY